MKYHIQPHRRSFNFVTHDGADLGSVELPCQGYPVLSVFGKTIAVVNSIEDAVLVLEDWQRRTKSWELKR
jgi:hypothetical protein